MLLQDNYPNHCPSESLKNIRVYAFPANASNKLQLIDQHFKQKYGKCLIQFIIISIVRSLCYENHREVMDSADIGNIAFLIGNLIKIK